MDVLVVGDANPDLVLAGDAVPRFGQAEQLLERADLVLGGSAAIVACGLARLGVATGLAAVVGQDHFGGLVRTWLTEAGVDVGPLAVDPARPTGLSVVLLGNGALAGDRTTLTLPGTIPALSADHVRAAVQERGPRHVHLASYFLQPALAAELPVLLGWLRGRGVSTSLDPNWDPSERWAGLDAVLGLVDVLLPNEAEVVALARALGHDVADPGVAATALAARGARVVVKQGADGALSVGPDGVLVRVPALPAEPVDTTGAGDSFDAGYLAALTSGAALTTADESERLRWAVAAGGLSTRGVGGTATQATRADLGRLLP